MQRKMEQSFSLSKKDNIKKMHTFHYIYPWAGLQLPLQPSSFYSFIVELLSFVDTILIAYLFFYVFIYFLTAPRPSGNL